MIWEMLLISRYHRKWRRKSKKEWSAANTPRRANFFVKFCVIGSRKSGCCESLRRRKKNWRQAREKFCVRWKTFVESMQIFHSSKFAREYRALPDGIRLSLEQKIILFRKNPFDRQLKTHKLSGRFSRFWSFSVNQKYRVIFRFIKNNAIWFLSVGDHSIYY